MRTIGFITGRKTKWLVLIGWLVAVALAAPVGGKLFSSTQDSYETYLSADAESTKVLAALKAFPGGDSDPMAVVYVRSAGVTAQDKARAEKDRTAIQGKYVPGLPPLPVTASKDGKALLFQIPVPHPGGAE